MSELNTICFLLGVIIALLIAIGICKMLNNAPTVDAVPVVRCKDCKWRGELGCAITIVDESDEPKDDDFCAWGERE